MKIALVTPSPIPFTIGGAEKLFIGMLQAFNSLSTHQMELIKLPCKDQEFWSLMECYRRFYHLDLSHFDAVITTKYPAWMIRHPYHILYMQHTCRGVYDLYQGERDFTTITRQDPRLAPLEKLLLSRMTPQAGRAGYEQVDIDAFFDLLFSLKERVDSGLFAFPNPLTRAIIHFLDFVALEDVHSFNAISKNVAMRQDYFPAYTPVQVIHHPTSLSPIKEGRYDYIFTASRLEDLKRIDLLIKAYRKVKSDLPFYIAGTGGRRDYLEELAKGDERIRFLGFVSDEDLIRYYADSLFIPYIPYDEDYGLITIEAMSAKKAILTTCDSGGVQEFVQDGHNGLVVEPTLEALAQAMQKLVDDKEGTIQMGKNAKKNIAHISWKNLIQKLTSPSMKVISQKPAPTISVVSTFPIIPPRSGGQKRIYYLHKYLSKHFDIEILSLASPEERYHKIEDGSLVEIRIPKTPRHHQEELQMEAKVGLSITDIMIDDLAYLTPLYMQHLSRALQSPIVVAEHPYTFGLLYRLKEELGSSAKLVHSSHNVEYLLKKQMLPSTPEGETLLQKVYDLESLALHHADLTYACTAEDAKRLKELYNYQGEIHVIPNGVEPLPYTTPQEREKLKNSLGIERKVAIFTGSYHKPNIEAVEHILQIARKVKDMNFIIVGSVKDYFQHSPLPNVAFTGVIDEEEKNFYLRIADVALNPITTGGGSNLKLIEYIAAGIPTITTPLGARGYEELEPYMSLHEVEKFDSIIDTTLPSPPPDVSKAFYWHNMVNELFKLFQKLLDS